MDVQQYIHTLPLELATAVHDLLNFPQEVQEAYWSVDAQTSFTHLCNAVKGEVTSQLNWTEEQWMAVPRVYFRFFHILFSFGQSVDMASLSEDTKWAVMAPYQRVPIPPFSWEGLVERKRQQLAQQEREEREREERELEEEDRNIERVEQEDGRQLLEFELGLLSDDMASHSLKEWLY